MFKYTFPKIVFLIILNDLQYMQFFNHVFHEIIAKKRVICFFRDINTKNNNFETIINVINSR